MTKSSLDFCVGLFFLSSLIAILFLLIKVGNVNILNIKSNYTLKMYFDNIGNLKKYAPVKSSGVIIGQVKNINFDNISYRAIILISVDKQYKFPKDSVAKIQTSGLLGEQYISLEPGSNSVMLINNDVIKTTQSALVLENMIGQILYNIVK